MPQNELLDRIYDCFQEYNYWSLRTLKERLNQPESYLRSTLERIAEPVKTGTFAQQWTLKADAKLERYATTAMTDAKEEPAPDEGADDGAPESFEDVELGGTADGEEEGNEAADPDVIELDDD